jgi:hypothetical protein
LGLLLLPCVVVGPVRRQTTVTVSAQACKSTETSYRSRGESKRITLRYSVWKIFQGKTKILGLNQILGFLISLFSM